MSKIIDIHLKVLSSHFPECISLARNTAVEKNGFSNRNNLSKSEKNHISENKFSMENAELGAVVTRFPPEASGFLHIGHAKAAFANRIIADTYNGKMLFRFDDTNPSKEKESYEVSIIEDLRSLGITWDQGPTYSSDYFPLLMKKAEELIDKGLAYCDKTPREELQKLRFDGLPTLFRDNSVDENRRLWTEMLKGSTEGLKTCLRAKISVDSPNKALRDPVLYRTNLEPHIRTECKFKVYPTYDFCCPIVDSIEGVTHALRTNEYHDRNDQYYWICDKLELRKPHLEDFSRLNMEYSVMSKRKLAFLVDSHIVTDWDDPRLPTVRGLLRRGVQVEALKEFIKIQGMSKVINYMEWSKLWSLNAQILDPTAHRYTVVSNELKTHCTVHGQQHMEEAYKPLHKKFPEMGQKKYYKSDIIFLDAEDVALITEGDEVTLMDWGNAFIRNIVYNNAHLPVSADIHLNPDGDFKKTKFKLTWIPKSPNPPIAFLHEYDQILTKKKIEPNDEIENIVAKHSLFKQEVLAEEAFARLKKGDIVQLERRGFYIVDEDSPYILICIPDGREKVNHLSAKAQFIKSNPDALPVNLNTKASKTAAEILAARKAEKLAKKQSNKKTAS